MQQRSRPQAGNGSSIQVRTTTSRVIRGRGWRYAVSRDQLWGTKHTDGYVIGPVALDSTFDVQLLNTFTGGPTIGGLSSWAAYSADGSEPIMLELVEGRRVRVEPQCPAAVPVFRGHVLGGLVLVLLLIGTLAAVRFSRTE